MADARITNVDTGDSTDVSCVYPHVGPNLAQSMPRPCKCVQYLFNSLMFTTLLTKKHD